MDVKTVSLGFGVEVEIRTNDQAKIHNLKSNGKSVRNLGVKFLG